MYVRELDLFVTVILLEDTPAVFSLEKLCEDHGYNNQWTSGQKPHLIKKWQENQLQHSELCTLPCPWSIDKFFNLIFIYSSSQETVTSSQHPASTRSESVSEEVQVKMTTTRKCEETCRMICQSGWRSSGTVWEMSVFQNIETLPVLLMTYVWSREPKWYRVNTTFLLTSRKIGITKSVLRTKITGASCRRRSGKIGWFSRCGSQSSEWRMWISKQSSIRCRCTRLCYTMDRVV